MTDAHCHVSCGDGNVREFLIGRDFVGVHPWEAEKTGGGAGDNWGWLRERLFADERVGVGEIGLDRLRERDISPMMREAFEAQLQIAAEFRRPVVLHGAKCWGQVVRTVASHATRIPSFLFHGFSRSDGLIPDIVRLNGYISVGPAVLNDHAVNYRELVKKIPIERLLLETDRTPENAEKCPSIWEVARKVAELRGVVIEELERQTDENLDKFMVHGCTHLSKMGVF